MFERFINEDVEQCAVLVSEDGGRTFDLVEVRNIHTDPTQFFAISKREVEGWLADHPTFQLIGFLHTHLPDDPEVPSDADMEWMQHHPTMWGAVLHTGTRVLTWFDHTGIIDREQV